MVVDLQGFGLAGYLRFGAVTFSQVFCNSIEALLKTPLADLPLAKKLFTDAFAAYPPSARFLLVVVSEAVLTCGFRLAVFSPAG